MSRKILTLGDVVGKTITGYKFAAYGGQLAILVDDDSVVLLGTSGGYDGDAEIEEMERFDAGSFGVTAAIESGLVTRDELDAAERQRREDNDRILENHDRKTYERLKKKFG
jgi:hypothetical protein